MKDLKSAVLLVIVMTLILGGIYPAAVTGAARLLFPLQAGGSLITDGHGETQGSALIGQSFTEDKYFWPRPSATGGFAYNPLMSSGSNLGPSNPTLLRRATERVAELRRASLVGEIPVDLVTASASGLDPHISPEAAFAQVPRVARARRMSNDRLRQLVARATEDRQLGILGMPRVNVLSLNLTLDRESR